MMYKCCRDTATQSKQSMFFFHVHSFMRDQKVKNIKLFRAEQKCEKDKG